MNDDGALRSRSAASERRRPLATAASRPLQLAEGGDRSCSPKWDRLGTLRIRGRASAESHFFLFTEGESKGALHLRPTRLDFDPYALAKGELSIDPPLCLERASGSKALDVVTTSDAPLVLISPRLQKVLGGFSGWDLEPVRIRDVALEGYGLLIVRGRCDAIDKARSVEVTKVSVYSGRPYRAFLGLFFDEASWDGSDLFFPRGSTLLFVTDRVRAACEKSGITNVRFRRPDEIERLPAAL